MIQDALKRVAVFLTLLLALTALGVLFTMPSHAQTADDCLDCHEEALTENPEELKIQKLAQEGENDVFRKLFRLADHAFYSHRAHVGGAGLPCETCHGAIAQSTAPPERPLIRISMDFCIDCHEKSGASTDCTRCHH